MEKQLVRTLHGGETVNGRYRNGVYLVDHAELSKLHEAAKRRLEREAKLSLAMSLIFVGISAITLTLLVLEVF